MLVEQAAVGRGEPVEARARGGGGTGPGVERVGHAASAYILAHTHIISIGIINSTTIIRSSESLLCIIIIIVIIIIICPDSRAHGRGTRINSPHHENNGDTNDTSLIHSM